MPFLKDEHGRGYWKNERKTEVQPEATPEPKDEPVFVRKKRR